MQRRLLFQPSEVKALRLRCLSEHCRIESIVPIEAGARGIGSSCQWCGAPYYPENATSVDKNELLLIKHICSILKRPSSVNLNLELVMEIDADEIQAT